MGNLDDLHYEVTLEEIDSNIAANKDEVEKEKALLNAAIQGDYIKIKQLLKSGINVDAKEYNELLLNASKNYFTPLQFASLHGHDECAELLMQFGANKNAKDRFGVTPLHLATSSGAKNIVKILLKARAAASLPVKFPSSLRVKFFTMYHKFPYLDGSTPLHIAALTNHVDCVKVLIRYGADFNAVDIDGRTSLYIAAERGYNDCVLMHLKEAIGRDILSLPSFTTSNTPLHFAVKYQMVDCVKELLRLGSDVNHRNNEGGLSPLHTALLPVNSNVADSMTILKLLVLEGHKTDINLPDWKGFTPLHYACFQGRRNMARRPEMAKFLMSYGAKFETKDCNSRRLLMQELTSHPEEEFGLLRYMVKSLLFLPRLQYLGITPGQEYRLMHEFQQLRRNQNIPNWALIRHAIDAELEMELGEEPEEEPEYVDLESEWFGREYVPNEDEHRVLPTPREDSRVVMQGRSQDEDEDTMDTTDDNSPRNLLLQKQYWYEKNASSPRSLQHQCRFVIRKTLGPMKIKHINRLPLPRKIHSYLLFELVE